MEEDQEPQRRRGSPETDRPSGRETGSRRKRRTLVLNGPGAGERLYASRVRYPSGTPQTSAPLGSRGSLPEETEDVATGDLSGNDRDLRTGAGRLFVSLTGDIGEGVNPCAVVTFSSRSESGGNLGAGSTPKLCEEGLPRKISSTQRPGRYSGYGARREQGFKSGSEWFRSHPNTQTVTDT